MLWFYILKSQCKVWGEGGSDRPVYCPTHQNLLHRLADIRHIYYIYEETGNDYSCIDHMLILQ